MNTKNAKGQTPLSSLGPSMEDLVNLGATLDRNGRKMPDSHLLLGLENPRANRKWSKLSADMGSQESDLAWIERMKDRSPYNGRHGSRHSITQNCGRYDVVRNIWDNRFHLGDKQLSHVPCGARHLSHSLYSMFNHVFGAEIDCARFQHQNNTPIEDVIANPELYSKSGYIGEVLLNRSVFASDCLWARLAAPWGNHDLLKCIAGTTEEMAPFAEMRRQEFTSSLSLSQPRSDIHTPTGSNQDAYDTKNEFALRVSSDINPNVSFLEVEDSGFNAKMAHTEIGRILHIKDDGRDFLGKGAPRHRSECSLTALGESNVVSIYWRDRQLLMGYRAHLIVDLESLNIVDFGVSRGRYGEWEWGDDANRIRKSVEAGELPDENLQPLPIIDRGVLSSGVIMAQGMGLLSIPGEPQTNLSGWNTPEDVIDMIEMANVMLNGRRSNELRNNPKQLIRSAFLSEEGVRKCVGFN